MVEGILADRNWNIDYQIDGCEHLKSQRGLAYGDHNNSTVKFFTLHPHIFDVPRPRLNLVRNDDPVAPGLAITHVVYDISFTNAQILEAWNIVQRKLHHWKEEQAKIERLWYHAESNKG